MVEDNGGIEFLELLQLQGDNEMVTKTELLRDVRAWGASITDRQLTTYITEGLVPKSARIGSRAGAFPAIVVDLVCFVSQARKRGLSVPAIRELLPVWKFMKRSVLREMRIDLAELEYVVRQHVHSQEAAFTAPWLVHNAIPWGLCDNCSNEIVVVYRDGEERSLAEGDPPVISFVMAEPDENDPLVGRPVSSMHIILPRRIGDDDKTRVTIGVPNGVVVKEYSWPDPCDANSAEAGATNQEAAEAK